MVRARSCALMPVVMPLRGIDGDGEVGAVALAILQHHALEAELLRALVGDGRADEPAPVRGHEVHGGGGHLLRGHHEVALVLTVGVVGDHDHFSGTDVFDDVFDRIEVRCGWHGRRTMRQRHGAGQSRCCCRVV